MKIKLLTLWMCLALLLTGCGKETVHRDGSTLTGGDEVAEMCDERYELARLVARAKKKDAVGRETQK